MRTIAYLITGLDRGGAELALLRLVLGLDRSRFRPFVFSLTDAGPVAGDLEAAGIPVAAVHADHRPLRGPIELALRLRSLHPALLHCLLFHANIAGRIVGRLAGVPRIVSAVRVCEEDRPWRCALDRLTFRWTDVETCVAEAVRGFTRRAAGVPEERLVVIRNGIDARAERGTRAGTGRRVVTVAHLRVQKGIDDLVRAAARVRAVLPEATFTVVGRGDPEPFRALARGLGVEGSFRFAGEARDVSPFLADADLFALPSRWEGLPNAVLEAMAAGLPVVATAVGGTPEVVRDGVTGRLVPPRSPSALADALVALLQDPARARAMGEAGLARVRAEFDVERMVREHEALYDRLLTTAQRTD